MKLGAANVGVPGASDAFDGRAIVIAAEGTGVEFDGVFAAGTGGIAGVVGAAEPTAGSLVVADAEPATPLFVTRNGFWHRGHLMLTPATGTRDSSIS